MLLIDALEQRHSIRAYRPDAVPKELLDKMIYAASLAPSAFNEQPWRYYIVTGESRQRLGEIMVQGTHFLEEYIQMLGHEMNEYVLRWYSELGNAPVVIVCTLQNIDDDFMKYNGYLAIGASIQNMLLTATALGLGSCYMSFSYWVRDEIARMLEVPDDRTIAGLLSVGYPVEEPLAGAQKLYRGIPGLIVYWSGRFCLT